MNANTTGDAVEVKIDKNKTPVLDEPLDFSVLCKSPGFPFEYKYIAWYNNNSVESIPNYHDKDQLIPGQPNKYTGDQLNFDSVLLTGTPTRSYHAANKKYVDDGFVAADKSTGKGTDSAYVRSDADGRTLQRNLRYKGTPEASWIADIAAYTSRATLIAADPTKAQDVVTLNYFNNNVHTTFKYKHVITVSLNKLSTSSLPYDTGKIYITLYSSNNLKVDSYADFTTIVGNTFTENCNGYVVTASASKQILRFSRGYLTIIGATDSAAQEIAISNFSTTWTDVITTM